jgi:hypothetical protein
MPPPGEEPVLAPPGTSPAASSDPSVVLDDGYHIYEANPVPWWVALIWASFFVFAVTYLILNLIG